MNPKSSEKVLTPRRTVRNRNKPQKYGEFVETSPSKRVAAFVTDSSSEEESSPNKQPLLQKPRALFTDGDVQGQDIFKFKSRHNKTDLQNKVKDAIINSPRVVLTPMSTPRKKLSSCMKGIEATPKHIKDVIKKRITKEVASDSEDDFSGSSSDFVPDDTDDSSQAESNTSESEAESVESRKSERVLVSKNKSNKMKTKDTEYLVKPDDYFMMHSSKKITTSDHTLARLKNLNLDENILEHDFISEEHKNKMLDLNKSYKLMFDKWLYVLSEQFNIVLYGIGSKRSILHQFQKEKLEDFPCIVVNGYFPSLTIKNILETIIVDLLENTHMPSNIRDVVSLIDTQLRENDMELFLIIHNIDGPMLRNAKTQAMLASISQIRNVHTIATIDHINAPLLWDHSKLSKFKFTWWDVTTFMPYKEETSYENSLMNHRSGALQLSSLKSVYQSLTSNAKGIYNIIINYQMENHKQKNYQGLPFKDLYSKSREQFLVSSDVALRAQLTEFLDHKLVKMKRSCDGSENLVIPIDNTLLQQFLEQHC